MREAIANRTGQRFLAGLNSDEAMFRHLMDNAIASKQQLALSVGVSLSPAQVAALTHDIVWMEEHVVNGEKVLVPVLYLAHAHNRLAPNGALIQGKDVTLIAGGELSNQGTLRASNNLSASGQNLNNAGLIEAGDRVSLLAEGSIRNAHGGLIAGRDVSAIALTGDIVNERTVTEQRGSGGGFSWQTSVADNAARIEAANDLSLSAGRDLSNLGGVLSAGGNASLSAGRDLTLGAATEVDHREGQGKRWQVSETTVTQHGSEVKVGGDLKVEAGRDLAVIASQVSAGRDIDLAAGRDLDIASAANESHFASDSKRKGKKLDIVRDSVRQQGSLIDAGGDFTAISGRDLTLTASQVNAGDEAYLYAGNDLSLLAEEDRDYSLYDKKKKGSFGSKQTQRDEVTDIRTVGSGITSGGDLSLVSAGDQRYQGATLQSGKDLTLDSGGAIAFEAVKDLRQESHEKSKSDLAWTSAKGKGTTDETVRQSELVAQGEIAIKAVDGLKVDLKHLDQHTVSQTIDAMVQADPNLAWLKELEQRGDVDWQRVQEVHDSFKYSHSGLGAGAQLVIAIVAAAILGPLTGALASNVAVGTINNGGDLGQGIKFALNEDNLKSYAISAATAYLVTPALDQAFGVSTDATHQITKGFDLGNLTDIAKFSLYSVAQGAAQGGIETAVQGGSFGDNVKDALATQAGNVGMAIGFNLIGDWALGKYPEGSPQKVMAHALMGGLVAEATGSDFKTGALAAGANEALSDALSNMVGGDENLELMSSQLVGLFAAATVNGDLEKGSEIAKYATAYNQQVHREAKQRLERGLEALHGQGKYQNLDAETVITDLRKIADGNITSTAELNPEVLRFLNTEFSPAGLRDTLFEPENWEIYTSVAIDLVFPTPSSKAAAVRTIKGKVSPETLKALEIKYGAESLAGAKGVIKSSETIGRPVEAVINGRKQLLRVDIEPNGKLQIQAGTGKNSIIDFRPDLSKPLAPQINSYFKRLPQSVRNELIKNAEKGLERLQKTGNM